MILKKDIFTCKIFQTMARQTPDGYRININSTVEPDCRGPAQDQERGTKLTGK